MPVVGIDPGATGAIVLYDKGLILDMADMPVYTAIVNKSERKRIDPFKLLDLFETYQIAGAELALIEEVGGRKKQSAVNSFNFGFGTGVVYACLIASKIPVETVSSVVWKRVMRVPGKARAGIEHKANEEAIMHRAQETFPTQRDLFYTKRGATRIDRAEAALLAKYCEDYALRLNGQFAAKDAVAKLETIR